MSLEEEVRAMTAAVTALTAAVTALDATVALAIPAIGGSAADKAAVEAATAKLATMNTNLQAALGGTPPVPVP
jgi:hypothetical protein